VAPLAPCATRAQQPYTEISYQSGGLRIQGYFYQPDGSGPFPTLIYSHGSRAGFERRSIPWVRLARLFIAAGYAVLVPERRGYGRSDGPAWSEAVGRDVGSVLIARLQAEADDVLAAVEYLRSVSSVDIGDHRLVARRHRHALRDFAQPQLSGCRRSSRRRIDVALEPGAASSADAGGPRCDMPGLVDGRAERRRPEAIPTLSQVMDAAGLPHRLIMYPAFTPTAQEAAVAPGHLLFSAAGLQIWGRDAIGFFDAYLRQ
jgi:pimeloyl-ACP methyl ester carboxylesterase